MSHARAARLWLDAAPAVLPPSALRAVVQAARAGASRVRWTPVEHDPYASRLEMAQRSASDGVLAVYSGHSEGLPWSALDNWRSRASHDMDHIAHGFPFTAEGERLASRLAASRLPGLAWFYASEVYGQAAVNETRGAFAPQKIVRDWRLTRLIA